MVILHIAAIENNMCNGVNVIVPQHIKAQSKYADIAFINVKNIEIHGIKNQFKYSDNFTIDSLPEPFNAPQLVVFHEAYRVEYIRISKLLRKQGIPYIIVPHGELTVMAQRKKWLKKKVANILLFNRFIKSAKALQVLSLQEKNTTIFVNDKFIATNGVDLPIIYKQNFRNTGIKLIYIGRLDAYHKGLDLMLDAVSRCSDFMRQSHASLDIFGPDYAGRYANIEKIIYEKKLYDIVNLHHEITGKEKENALLNADIFIQTSRFEGMPLGILEALSYGVPCFVTEGTTLGELIEKYDAGWKCATNVDDISRMFYVACSDYINYINKSKKARQIIMENFTWDRVVIDALMNYQKLLHEV